MNTLIKSLDDTLDKSKESKSSASNGRLDCVYKEKLEYREKKKEKILNGILESVLDGILVVNDESKVIHVNNQFLNMLSVPFEITDRTTNSDIIDILKKQIINSEEFTKSIDKEWESEKEYVKYLYFKNKKIFEVSTVPFYDNELVMGRVIIYRDITEKRKIEELQKQVEINEALLEKAKEYDELKTNFFCTISHELKTPINIILGIIQLLSSRKESDLKFIKYFSFNKYVNIMKQNCYRLIKLSNNLIDINKIETGYTTMELKNHNIISIIEEITLSVADYIKSKDITLIFDTNVEEKMIACDDEQMERVMLNLLSNAVKFTQPKGIIEVNVKDNIDYILISVKDNGCGIPKDKQEIIFDRFGQVDSSLRRPKEGSGIGLALVKSIVEKHGGNILLRSEVNKGSEFIIELKVDLLKKDDSIKNDVYSKDTNAERINIEFSDIYELNIH